MDSKNNVIILQISVELNIIKTISYKDKLTYLVDLQMFSSIKYLPA